MTRQERLIPTSISHSQRFSTLDGVRGVAAIAVVLFHYSEFNGTPWLLHGWVAVDVFVCLSGFVIAHTYRTSIENGLSLSVFAQRRLNRLYPLYVVGLICGAIAFLASESDRNALTPADTIKAFVFGVFVLPFPSSATISGGMGTLQGPLFPFNAPSWSMFFELAVNGAFFAMISLRFKYLKWVTGISAVLYIGAALAGTGLNSGWNTETFLVGFPRVMFAFLVGVLLHSWHISARHVPMRYAILSIITMLLIFIAPESKWVSLFGVLLTGPLVVWVCAATTPSPQMAQLFGFLGRVSYPLYIIHLPLLYGMALLLFGQAPPRLHAWSFTITATSIAVLAAWGLSMLDAKIRRLLR